MDPVILSAFAALLGSGVGGSGPSDELAEPGRPVVGIRR
jgi:hypothetical protein